MIINGKWMSEPEIIALISQLTADKKRLERQLEQTAKRGKWIPYGRDSGYNSFIRCSECGHEVTLYADSVKVNPNFCENCGADMRENKNNRTNTKDEA